MTALEEIRRTGRAGDEVVTMLMNLVAQEGRSGSFPAPHGHDRWTDQAVMDHVATLFTRKQGLGFILAMAVKAENQQSLERSTLKAIRNDLIDEAKGTRVGKLRRRLRTLFTGDNRFARGNDIYGGEEAWVLAASTKRPWSGSVEELQTLTANVTVADIDALPPSGPTPRAARESLVTLSHEGLRLVDAAVRAQLLARFLAERFGLDGVVEITGHEPTRDASYDIPGFDESADDLAEEIYVELSDEERWLVTVLSDDKAIRERLGAQSVHAAERLRDRLRPYASTDEGRSALGVLARRCGEEARE
jgi:hypothetical protein